MKLSVWIWAGMAGDVGCGREGSCTSLSNICDEADDSGLGEEE
jgi:hypothetical protein